MARLFRQLLLAALLCLCLTDLSAQDKSTLTDDLAAKVVAAASDDERAALLATTAPDGELVRAIVRRALQSNTQGRPEQALAALRYALKLADKLDPLAQARARNGLGSLYYSQTDYPQALDEYQQAVKLAETAGDKAALSQAWNGVGLIQRNRGDYPVALVSLNRALSLSQECGDQQLQGSQLNSIGNIYLAQGELSRAEEFYRRSLAIREAIKDKNGIAAATQNLAALALERGQYNDALTQFQKALALREGLKQVAGVADSLVGIGQVYRLQGNYQQALDFFQRTLPLREQTRDRAGKAFSLTNIGTAYYEMGDGPRALENYQQALAIREETGDKANTALLLNNISLIYDDLGQTAASLAACEKALAIYESLGHKRGIASTLSNMGETYAAQKDYAKAGQAEERAVMLSRENQYANLLWKSLTNLAFVHAAQKRPGPAQECLREAIAIIENLRVNSFGTEQERRNFFDKKIAPYELMASVLQQQGQDAEALAYAERAKSRVLLDVLREGRADINKSLTAAEREREKQLNEALDQANDAQDRAARNAKAAPAQLQEAAANQQKARYELAAYANALYLAHPELKIQRGEAPTLTLAQANQLLPDANAALLEFVVADQSALLFVLTQAANAAPVLKSYALDLTAATLATSAEGFRQKLARRDLGFQAASRELYDQLLKPAAAQLSGKNALVIVPDGPLWNLPFQALQAADGRYLIENAAVSYAPSLTVLREMKRARQQKNHTADNAPALLAFGNPSLPAKPPAGPSLMGDDTLTPLPEAEKQTRELARLYGPARSKIYVGAEAREDRVAAEAGRYRILQFATHGVLDDANPLRSYVLLARSGATAGTDGRLEAREMMDLNLNADLVVLSACETARGRTGAGEGAIGMAWALFVAGVPATVASQWKVESASTTALMLELHRQLLSQAKNANTANALRQAQLKLLRGPEYRHPFYWAGFVLLGDER